MSTPADRSPAAYPAEPLSRRKLKHPHVSVIPQPDEMVFIHFVVPGSTFGSVGVALTHAEAQTLAGDILDVTA